MCYFLSCQCYNAGLIDDKHLAAISQTNLIFFDTFLVFVAIRRATFNFFAASEKSDDAKKLKVVPYRFYFTVGPV